MFIDGFLEVFACIPGRSGILGNEYADKVANDFIICEDVANYKIYNHNLVTILNLSIFLRNN